ncbi:MAG: hypothetical protein PGN13_03910 [Patulibacter minatonensis]
MPARRAVPLCTVLLASGLWVLFGATSVVNYDTLYGILWGDQLLHGHAAEFTAAGAPTPHPLLTLLGAVAAPIAGDGSAAGLAVVAYAGYAATAACAVLLCLVGLRSVGALAGIVAAVVLITREPVLSYGLRAYLDLPYLALLLAALAFELSRPRRGAPVLAMLALAGLLRPEAWLLSAAYVVWLTRTPDGWRRPALGLLALAFAAPVLWVLSDLLLTGNALFSFDGTRAGAERLDRPTGLSGLVTVAPQRIGEILREDGLLGALVGAGLLATRRPKGAGVVIVATLTALAAFSVVALGGLPVIVRYLLPFGAVGALAYGYALTGWRSEPSIPLGRAWSAGAVALLVLTVALSATSVAGTSQVHRIDRLHAALEDQQAAIDEAREIVDGATCGPIAVPNRRAVPLVAMWTGRPAASVVTTQDRGVPARGTYLLPSSPEAAKGFVLDARDRDRAIPPTPAGWRTVARSAHWVAVERCG